jgi:hypothetical protein
MAFYLLPRKGVAFTDEGWHLASAFMAAQGKHLDITIPQAPSYNFNAILMAMGLESYLFLRYAFYALIAFSCYMILIQLKKSNDDDSSIAAMLLPLAWCSALTSLFSYNTGPVYLLLAGIAFIYWAISETSHKKKVFFVIVAGFLLTGAGFSCFTVYPAIFFTIMILWLGLKRPKEVPWSAAVLVISSLIAVATYLALIGYQTLFRFPGGHSIELWRLESGVWFFCKWMVFWFVIAFAIIATLWLVRRFFRYFNLDNWRWLGLPGLTCGAVLFLLQIGHLMLNWNVPQDIHLHYDGLSARVFRSLCIYQTFLVFEIVGFWAFGVLSFALVFCARRDWFFLKATLVVFSLFACYVCHMFFSLTGVQTFSIYYAGPFFLLGFYLVYHSYSKEKRWQKILFFSCYYSALAMTFTGLLIFCLYYNHPGNLTPILEKKERIGDLPRLTGLMETPTRIETLRSLKRSFDTYGCRDKIMYTFNCTAFLNYYLNKEAVSGAEYIYIPFLFPEKMILDVINSDRPWCIFVSRNVLTNEHQVWAQTDIVMSTLNRHSAEIVKLSPSAVPRDVYDDFVLYVGPK